MERDRVSKTRACAECKAKKLRCCASREAPSTCYRCYQHGIECTVPEKRPRKRPSRLHTRMATLEGMVGSLVDRLPGPTPHASSREVGASARSSNALHDPLTNGLLSMTHAETLCRQYRQMAEKHFPCVLVPRGMGVRGLQCERPVLFQAMLVVASWQDRPRQVSLESFFLGDLSARFFVKGERSLDLLQGLLVYLAWYHFNVAEAGHYHAHRLASLCTTMIVDLGINQKPPRATQESTVHCQLGLEHGAGENPEYWSHEARRTLIGVYIQSSLCSIMCRKPSPLPYSSYMEQCARSLQDDHEVESDKALLYFIQVVRIINDVYHVFVIEDADRDESMGEDQVQMAVRALKEQLSAWWTSLPRDITHHAQLHTWGDLAGAYAHEIGLHGHVRHGPISATRVSVMFDCLAHVEAFMDRTTSISREDMQTWTAFDWRQLTYTTTLASKISVAIDAATSDEASTGRIARLHSSLDVVSTRTQELFAMTNTPPGQGHYFQNLLQQWKGIRSWYQAVLKNRSAHHTAGGIVPDDPVMSSDLSGGPLALQSLDSWPDDNFGILPISTGDLMMLESLDYSQPRMDS